MTSRLARTLRPGTLAVVLSSPLALAQVGTPYCTPAVPNSTGQPAAISALGSADLGNNANRLTLVASDLPPNQFGIFLTSRTQGFVANPGGSVGNLCLAGNIGRYAAPGQLFGSGTTGRAEFAIDLAFTPEGGGLVQVMAGETWNYQAWFRDVSASGTPASNLSDALEVQYSDTCPSCALVPGMVPIPAGTFRMGSDAPLGVAPYFNSAAEQPVHDATISYSFWMGQYEVTQAEFEAVMGFNPSIYIGPQLPVHQISWVNSRLFCTLLTSQNSASIPVGYEYRLPTEAEWEYACRAGTTTEFHTGAELFCNQAQIAYSMHSVSSCGLSLQDPMQTVGRYQPNAFGLYDMHGNAWEWCLDSIAPYSASPVVDPFVTGATMRCVRGGTWFYDSSRCRSADRHSATQGFAGDEFGFRIVLAPIRNP